MRSCLRSCASCGNSHNEHLLTNKLIKKLRSELCYEDLMDFWQKKFPEKIYELNYDKLTENQELESRKIFNYLGLKWENSVLEFHNNSRVVQTTSNIQVRKKMYKGSSQQWKKYKPWLQSMINNLKKN